MFLIKIKYFLIACSFVLMLFIFQDSITLNKDIELVKVSGNITNNIENSTNNNC